jgi:hypothetical protein
MFASVCRGVNAMSETVAYWQEISHETHQDRRKAKRVPLAFPINVCGMDPNGHFFSEDTATHDISEQGCRFHVQRRPQEGDALAIRLMSRDGLPHPENRALLFEVRWVLPDGDGWLVGTFCLQPRNLWNMTFTLT